MPLLFIVVIIIITIIKGVFSMDNFVNVTENISTMVEVEVPM